jgi:hypothetical protein
MPNSCCPLLRECPHREKQTQAKSTGTYRCDHAAAWKFPLVFHGWVLLKIPERGTNALSKKVVGD